MDTNKLKPEQPGDKKDKSKKGTQTNMGVAAGAAAAGGIAGAMVNDSLAEGPIVTPEPVPAPPAPEPDVVEPDIVEPEKEESEIITPAQDTDPQEAPPIVAADLEPEPEPQPVTPQPEPGAPIEEPSEIVEPMGMPNPEYIPGNVDVNNVVEDLLADVEEDPNDIDMEDVINFDEIGTVYTVTGESYTAAAFHDTEGNELLMVDVDGDHVFDVITTPEGEILAQTAGDLNVGDAELMINDAPTYLAQNDMDQLENATGENFADDIINNA